MTFAPKCWTRTRPHVVPGLSKRQALGLVPMVVETSSPAAGEARRMTSTRAC